jgi:carbohydrate kinase (thermoresistant glucokinase family)
MPALRLIVMGVSGCGKSTVSQALADRLGLDMVDGDDLHLPESVAKMRSGIALQDVDRWPWLDRIGSHLADSPDAGPGRVVACSALRRAYRDRIRARAGQVCFLFLKGDFELIAQRMRQRVGHYMQAGLLDSQFQTLETPGPQETDVITLYITEPVELLVEQALAALKAHRSSLALHTPV